MRLSSDERGATALFVAVSMILMLGMAALAIDIGAGFNERRQDQTASDLAAVAGALSFGNNDAIADQVMAAARTNVDTQYSDADWTAAWAGCTDPNRPAGFTPIAHSTLGVIDCISLNPSFVRVRVPNQSVDTSFGRILGVDTLTTNADSIVTLLGEGGTGSLPFAVRGDSGPGYICLDTSTGSKIVPPCDGNEQGSFGNIAPPLFGNPFLGTSPECSNQTSNNNYVPESIAMGIDHIIWTYSAAQWAGTGFDPDDKNINNNAVDAVSNKDECTDTGGEIAEAADGVPINSVWVDTGNSTKKQITEGLMTETGFADGNDARLTRSSNTRRIDGYDLDNIPLWDHLLPASSHGVADCDGPTIRAVADIEAKSTAMQTCLVNYGLAGPQIFSDSILNSPRLGTTPRIWTNNLGTGLSLRPVKHFDIVYIHALWFDDKAETVFYPGEGTGPVNLNKMKEIEQVAAYLLVDDMVSQEVRTSIGGVTDGSFQPTIFE